jgi:hypothetical protein
VLYLAIMFQMPNRVYYAQFADMDADNLRHTITNVLLYTTVELLSLIVVHANLRRLLGFSPMYQLAFVLTRHAVHVQSVLMLWVVYSTQATLRHFGKTLTYVRSYACGRSRCLTDGYVCDLAVWHARNQLGSVSSSIQWNAQATTTRFSSHGLHAHHIKLVYDWWCRSSEQEHDAAPYIFLDGDPVHPLVNMNRRPSIHHCAILKLFVSVEQLPRKRAAK